MLTSSPLNQTSRISFYLMRVAQKNLLWISLRHCYKCIMVTTELTRRHCIFSGRVQGVGFRYATRNLAINFDVTGYVRNLPDGRIDVVMEGPAFEVDSFVEAINDRMKHYIRNAEIHEQLATGEFPQFTIAR